MSDPADSQIEILDVGIEDVDDIIADIDKALEKAA